MDDGGIVGGHGFKACSLCDHQHQPTHGRVILDEQHTICRALMALSTNHNPKTVTVLIVL
jgi:hypothetical protein